MSSKSQPQQRIVLRRPIGRAHWIKVLTAEYRQAVAALEHQKLILLLMRGTENSWLKAEEAKHEQLRDRVFDLRIPLWDFARKQPPTTTEELDQPPWSCAPAKPAVIRPTPSKGNMRPKDTKGTVLGHLRGKSR
jgi:hypothetical protein